MPNQRLHFRDVRDMRVERPDQVKRIVRVFDNRGFDISPMDAQSAWQAHSQENGSVWLYVPSYSDEEVFGSLQKFFFDR